MEKLRNNLMENTELKQNSDFIRSAYRKSVFPGMLAILSVNINVFVDGILVGNRIGEKALASITLSLPPYLLLCVIGSFFASGSSICSAQEIGRDNPDKSNRFFCTGMTGALVASVAITILGLLLLDPITALLCADAEIRPFVSDYLMITLIGAFPKIMIYMPFWYLRLDGNNKAIAIMMAQMTVTNIILDVFFVYGLNMGVKGAALASVIATTIAFVYGFVKLFGKGSSFRYRPGLFIRGSIDKKSLIEAGIPSAFNNLCSTIRLIIINHMLTIIGGGTLVAVFSAVNGIAGFAECITLGIPAAGAAMLGVFCGERDNGSTYILLKTEWRIGCILGVIFFALCTILSSFISGMYALPGSLLVPLFWLGLSVFPALFLNILTTYYNMSQHNRWANILIFVHVIAMTWLGLGFVAAADLSVFFFLLFAEGATILIWYVMRGVYSRRNPGMSDYLLMDTKNEKAGRLLNFSVEGEGEKIAEASEKIGEFCLRNGMDPMNIMSIEMAMEELMTVIVDENEGDEKLVFDLRAYSLPEVEGIRIRYGGKVFNPISEAARLQQEKEGAGKEAKIEPGKIGSIDDLLAEDIPEEDKYMGVRMVQKMVDTILYQRAFGVNTLQIIFKERVKDDRSIGAES